jgi:hypothetical protein
MRFPLMVSLSNHHTLLASAEPRTTKCAQHRSA